MKNRKRENMIDPDTWNEKQFYHFGNEPISLTLPEYIGHLESDSNRIIFGAMRKADTLQSVADLITDPEQRIAALCIVLHQEIMDLPGSKVPDRKGDSLESFMKLVARSAQDKDCL